jgi:arylsulfatase A-like enzyme
MAKRTTYFGYNIVREPVHVHDLHATLLHAMGVDHKRLTFRHEGRDYRLTDVAGNVIQPLLA